MTVKGLHQYIINRKSLDQENGINKHELTDLILPGATIGVDKYNFQFVSQFQMYEKRWLWPYSKTNTVLLVSGNDIDPIYVFDGAQKNR
jgi:hypothetical protein